MDHVPAFVSFRFSSLRRSPFDPFNGPPPPPPVVGFDRIELGVVARALGCRRYARLRGDWHVDARVPPPLVPHRQARWGFRFPQVEVGAVVVRRQVVLGAKEPAAIVAPEEEGRSAANLALHRFDRFSARASH